MKEPFADRIGTYVNRVASCLDAVIPPTSSPPRVLHDAMRYAALNGGKRVRPLVVYASGECLGVAADKLDAPAAAIEMIHAFSLVHDDLPAMDDDDLRRGSPTVHKKFDEATAILAGDALLPLAFGVLGKAPFITSEQKVALVNLIAAASGSLGMTGGQSIDLASEGKQLSGAEIEQMHGLKTGALIRASALSAACLCDGITEEQENAMDGFGRCIGLAFQIRDDLLDVEGDTGTIGKVAGSDVRREKATWPAIFGVEESRRRCKELLEYAQQSLEVFGATADSLRWLANYIVRRAQ